MNDLTKAEVLARLPRRRPARFIDEIVELDENHIVSRYTWQEEDCAGHFPGNPVVPGVKLVEMGAQTGNAAWVIYQLAHKVSAEELKKMSGIFTGIDKGNFKKMVRPGDTVLCRATLVSGGFSAGDELSAEIEIRFDGGQDDGEIAFTGVTTGKWVSKEALQ